MRKARLAAAVIGVGLSYGGVAKAAIFEGLGFLPGTDHSLPKAVSGDGSVVVGVSADALGLAGLIGGYAEAFRWTAGGGMQGLGDFSGGANFSSAISSSRDGSVIVGASDSDLGEQSFRWTGATGLVRLVPPSPYTGGIAFGVSRDGSVVVGENFIGGVSGTQPYRWTAATGEVPLDVLAGYTTSRPTAVSGDGNVVVGITANADNTSHIAFRWTAADGMQALPIPSGASAEAHVISADGHVIGGYMQNVTPNSVFAGLVIWDNGALQTIGGLGGNADVHVGGITGDGSILVGRSLFIGDTYHAFIWDGADGVRDLNFVLPEEYGIDLQGWLLNSAEGISDDGRVIAGYGTDPQGQMEAWVVVLPEPSLALLLIPGSLLLCRGRRKDC